jgi:hypothetical protein
MRIRVLDASHEGGYPQGVSVHRPPGCTGKKVREENHGGEVKEGHAGGENGRKVVHPWPGRKNVREGISGGMPGVPGERL